MARGQALDQSDGSGPRILSETCTIAIAQAESATQIQNAVTPITPKAGPEMDT